MAFLKKLPFLIILTTILITNLLRFYDLENTPKGFYIDEISSAVSAHKLATEGTDLLGKKWPLFCYAGDRSPHPPTQIYPLTFWVKIFGVSIKSIRGFSACVYTFGLIGIFLLARMLGGSTCAWLTLLASSISPWGWMFSRIAFESILGPVFLIWGIFFFLRTSQWFNMPLASFFTACAMYSYPPTRLHAPIVILLLIGYQIKQNKIKLSALGSFLIVLSLLCAPLITGTLQGGPLVKRFNEVSIFSMTHSWGNLIVIFTKNFFSHFNPDFLLLTGDNNYRHSTRHFGILSWLDMLAILAGLIFLVFSFKKREPTSPLVVFLLLAAASGIIPSALTRPETLPHALRSLGSQPFIELLVGYSLNKTLSRWPQILTAAAATGSIFAIAFLTIYFKDYPVESASAFMSDIRIEAEHCQTEKDWENLSHRRFGSLIQRYYIIRNYHQP